MNNPAPVSIAIFALTPPKILRKTDLIFHPVAHIGLSIANHYKDPAGVLVLFGPWLGQAKYETVNLYVSGNPNAVASEIVMDDSTPVELRLPPGLLLEDVNSLHCTVERPSGNTDTSLALNVLYHVYAPGGDDPVAGGGHSALGISVSPTSVDAAQAAQGVTLTLDWPDKHLYDLVTVDCGGVLLTHRIEPTSLDPVPDLTKPVVLTLYTQHFAKDRNNPQFPIKYSVISQTGNFSGTTHQGQFDALDHWSVPCLIDVHLDLVELEMAILREDPTENNDDPAIVDLAKLDGGPLWAFIHLIQPIWQAGDELHLIFTAVDGNGTVVATYEVTLKVGPVPGQMSVDIPNAKVIADSKVSVAYEQIRGGKVIGASRVATAQVTGSPRQGYESLEAVPLQTFSVNSPRTFPSGLTFTLLSQGEPTLLVKNDPIVGHHLQFGAKSRGRFSWNTDVKRVEFVHFHVGNTGSLVLFYGANGGFVSSQPLPTSVAEGVPQKFAYESTVPFRWFEIDSKGEITSTGFHIDEIRWTRN